MVCIIILYRFCSKCNDVVQSKRKTEFWKLPEILIIHFKRFYVKKYITIIVCSIAHFDIIILLYSSNMHKKENKMVTFPFRLYRHCMMHNNLF